MSKKHIVFLLTLMILISNTNTFGETKTGPLYNPDDSCENVLNIYDDALLYFKNNRGEQQTKKTLFGTMFYNDYKINLWDAQRIELTEAIDLGCNQLEYTYMESELLADGQNAYRDIVSKLENCLPIGYFKLDDANSKNYISKANYIVQKDKDAFLFYDWPEFQITLSNISNIYTVKLTIYSKKYDD